MSVQAAPLRHAPSPATAPTLAMRRGRPSDVEPMLALKQRLRIRRDRLAAMQVAGGFLLGVSRERYRELVAHANVLVLEDRQAGALAGFSVTLPDHLLRASSLWERRRQIAWSPAALVIADDVKVGYFDQIACAPHRPYRLAAPALALRALLDLIETGHQHIFATVVRQPVHNPAALELLAAVGARRVGQVAEPEHADVGPVVSDLYHLAGTGPDAPWQLGPLAERIQRSIDRMLAVGRSI